MGKLAATASARQKASALLMSPKGDQLLMLIETRFPGPGVGCKRLAMGAAGETVPTKSFTT